MGEEMRQRASSAENECVPDEEAAFVESYNDEPVHEYRLCRNGTGKELVPKKCTLRRSVHSLRAFCVEVFLPQGYPITVSSDYLDYQIYDTLQAFSSSLNGALATLAILKGVGVGNEQATVLAAALTWILKDGVGMLARIAFAWAKGTRLDSDCKRWRLFADLLNDLSFFIDLVNPYFPPVFFTPFACFASLLRSIVGVAGGATRMSIVRHQARRDNLADVAAKDGSQETLVNVVSLLVSLVLLPLVEGRPLLIWTLFCLFTATHLFANYRAVRVIKLETLNQNRLILAVRYFLEHGTAPSIDWCNRNEPILGSLGLRRRLGCALETLPIASLHSLSSAETDQPPIGEHDGVAWKRCSQSTMCVVASGGCEGWLAIGGDVNKPNGEDSSEPIFNALFELEHYAHGKGWPTPLMVTTFRREMAIKGWSLQVSQLNVDEWRFRRAEGKKTE